MTEIRDWLVLIAHIYMYANEYHRVDFSVTCPTGMHSPFGSKQFVFQVRAVPEMFASPPGSAASFFIMGGPIL